MDDPHAVAVTQCRAHVLGGGQEETGIQGLVTGLDEKAVEIPAADILHDDQRVPETQDIKTLTKRRDDVTVCTYWLSLA